MAHQQGRSIFLQQIPLGDDLEGRTYRRKDQKAY